MVLPLCALILGGCAGGGRQTRTAPVSNAQKKDAPSYAELHYDKSEHMVEMRDGVSLFTSVYAPKDKSRDYPAILFRTPYSCSPYGEDKYREKLGPHELFMKEGFIFVYQDVRGRFMSEGEFENMRPHIDIKRSPADIDEASDTYDTVDWIVNNLPGNNGKVGMWGISYPGFYTAAGMIDAHPALVAASPQAPIADWYFDDFHHHGALFLPHAFGFLYVFGQPRPEPTTEWGERFDYPTPDGYQFYRDLGPLKNVEEKYYKGSVAFWNDIVEHPHRDEFWQARDILPHLHNVSPAVLTVGGWFDAEDLWGPLKIYRSTGKKNPGVFNGIVMGPWAHGGWARGKGDRLGYAFFDADTSEFYNEEIIFPFFMCHLKGTCTTDLPEAYMFDTGRNEWRTFDEWPPRQAEQTSLFARAAEPHRPIGGLDWEMPGDDEKRYAEWVSRPDKPVPFAQDISTRMTRTYMTDDQRFASRRPDVVSFQTEVLEDDVTLAGPIQADLWVSTSGTASDWVVKVIDVFPDDAEDPEDCPERWHRGGYQMMVRSEVIRGRYRNSYERPEPFVPNQPTRVSFELQDVMHTFRKGHRIMIQVQSTWFPLVDINPHTYVENVFKAEQQHFTTATQRLYHDPQHATRIIVRVLPNPPEERDDEDESAAPSTE